MMAVLVAVLFLFLALQETGKFIITTKCKDSLNLEEANTFFFFFFLQYWEITENAMELYKMEL